MLVRIKQKYIFLPEFKLHLTIVYVYHRVDFKLKSNIYFKRI